MSNHSSNDNVITLLEAKLLGNLIHNNRAYTRISGIVEPEHFSDPIHGMILKAMLDIIGAGRVADVPALHSLFEKSGALDEVGGVAYLYQLPIEGAANSETVKLARQVRSIWAVNRLVDFGQELVALGSEATQGAFYSKIHDFSEVDQHVDYMRKRVSGLLDKLNELPPAFEGIS